MIFLPLAIIKIGIDPVLVRLGGLSIHWYGLMYVVGLATALYVTLPYVAQRGISRDVTYEAFWPLVIAGLIGGRLYYVVQSNFGWYLRHPTKILATWEGGMAFYGAVLAGMITLFVFCRVKHISFAVALDGAAVFAPLAQTFGRIGNIINGDILGYPSTLPWATEYTNPNNTFVPSHTTAYQPASAYELLFTLALFLLVWRLRFNFKVPGTLFFLWLLGYSVGQFALFFGRANIIVLFGLKQAQLTAIVTVVLAIPLYLAWRQYYLGREAQESERFEPRDRGGARAINAPR